MRKLAIKDDVILTSEHFRPAVAIMVQVVLEEAPNTTDGLVWLTDAWREKSDKPSYHVSGAAFDFRVWNIAPRPGKTVHEEAELWAQRVGRRLGCRYDALVHGPVQHLHIEKNANRPLTSRNEWTDYQE